MDFEYFESSDHYQRAELWQEPKTEQIKFNRKMSSFVNESLPTHTQAHILRRKLIKTKFREAQAQ